MKLLKTNIMDRDLCEELRKVPRSFTQGRIYSGEQSNISIEPNIRMVFESDVNHPEFEELYKQFVYDRLVPFFKLPENISYDMTYMRYFPGFFFSKHRDQTEARTKTKPKVRIVSVSICVADEYEGGDLVLYDENGVAINNHLTAGSLLAFDSTILHEVKPVTTGVRDVIVSWLKLPNMSEEYEAKNLERCTS
jgi:predicted 2-oxoglutarate/Fe(II)-dependent dioxygenase YbiX